MTRIPRLVALAALAALALTSAGCSVTNPQTTQLQYDPSDGVVARLDATVTVANLLIAATDAEGPGNLVGRIVNDGEEPVTVVLVGGGEGGVNQSFRVPARSSLGIGPGFDDQVLIDPVGEVPGGLVPMTVSLQEGRSVELDVPVVDGTLPEYATLVPTQTPTTSSPTPATPTVTDPGNPVGSPSPTPSAPGPTTTPTTTP